MSKNAQISDWQGKISRPRLTSAEQSRLYRLKNKESCKAKDEAYRLANKERLEKKAKVWRIANAQRISAEKRQARLANAEEFRAKDRQYYAANVERKRLNKKRSILRNRHSMSMDEWDSLFLSQGKRCAICQSTNSGTRGWHIDHCHVTGIVRGALCHSCNLLLGQAKDQIERLRAAILYLEKFQKGKQ